MTPSKLHFSAEEIELLKNQQWLLTKNTIIGKVYVLMGHLSERLQADLADAPLDLTLAGPKISMGENYKGLPYVMLDYPRYFKSDEICALRTFFWWGHFISVTLHLKGIYKEKIEDVWNELQPLLIEQNFRVSIDGSEWDHDVDAGFYHAISHADNIPSINSLKAASFLKISSVISLEEWDQIQEKIYSKQQLLHQLISDQLPKR